MYLAFSVFASRPTSLLGSIKVSVIFMVSILSPEDSHHPLCLNIIKTEVIL
jgi:hypothetical protein